MWKRSLVLIKYLCTLPHFSQPLYLYDRNHISISEQCIVAFVPSRLSQLRTYMNPLTCFSPALATWAKHFYKIEDHQTSDFCIRFLRETTLYWDKSFKCWGLIAWSRWPRGIPSKTNCKFCSSIIHDWAIESRHILLFSQHYIKPSHSSHMLGK